MKNAVLVALIVVVALFIVYQYDPSVFGLLGRREGFADAPKAKAAPATGNGAKMDLKMAANNTSSVGSVQNKVGQNGSSQKDTAAQPANGGQKMVAAGQDLKNDPPVKAAEPFGTTMPKKEGFADLTSMEGPANFASVSAPAGCYPRDQLTPTELLPADQRTIYAEQNPMGPGSLKGKNFLSAGALIGVNTVGQSLRNANLQLRSEPPNPQVPVSIFLQSTIQPDISHRPLEIGS
jgi:hypothetical protein